VHQITVLVANATAWGSTGETARNDVLPYCLASTHTILRVEGGEFVSLLDPPAELREHAAECRNVGTWPVLAGEDGARDTMLSSPIIIYDYPRIAPESAGDLFDATEIDEILSLRILTLTDEEKREIRETDERASQLLDRTESLAAEQLMRLHGTMRS
jgi:hydrogenase maturation protease